MVGYEQAGIGEVIETILNSYPQDIQDLMAKNVLITGERTLSFSFVQHLDPSFNNFRR